MRRRSAIVLAYFLLVALASGWLARLEWSLYGLVLRAMGWLGLVGGGNTYWGQIDGINIPTHSYMTGIGVRTLAALLVHGPLLVLCEASLSRSKRALAHRIPMTVRVVIALGVLGFVTGTYGQDISNRIDRLVIEHGDAWGCTMDWPWRMMPLGHDSRYQTADHPWLCRAILDHAPDLVRTLSGAISGLMAFMLLGLWKWPDDGIPRCVKCGYPIEGLTECPECGRASSPDGDTSDARG